MMMTSDLEVESCAYQVSLTVHIEEWSVFLACACVLLCIPHTPAWVALRPPITVYRLKIQHFFYYISLTCPKNGELSSSSIQEAGDYRTLLFISTLL